MAEFKNSNNLASRFINSGYNSETDSESNSNETNAAENFYRPLCKSGYLTPLQRKMLREKRKMDIPEKFIQSDMKSSQAIGKKKGKRLKIHSNIIQKRCSKKKDRVPLNGLKENTPVVRLAITELFTKKYEMDPKDKKFFKSLSPQRLEKVNFTMPFISKKGLRNFGNRKGNLNSKRPMKEASINNSSDSSFSESCEKDVIVESLNAAKSINISTFVKFCASNKNSPSPKKTLSSDIAIGKYDEIHNENSQNMDNSIIDHEVSTENPFEFDWPSDEVLLKRQERARAIFRQQNILKKCKLNQNCDENDKTTVPSKQMFYPLFNAAKACKKEHSKKIEPKRLFNSKKVSSKGGEQMIIDAGQTEIGAKICETCSMIYCIGQEEDEKLHTEYHNTYIVNLKFLGWKNENVAVEYGDGRVIMIRKEDKSFMLKKVEDVLEIANRDLGFPKAGFPTKPNVVFLLFISNERKVVGCLVAESISSAYQVVLLETSSNIVDEQSKKPQKKVWRIGNWYSSSTPVPAICGVNRIWVASDFRRCKVASRLVDCLRCQFLYGHVVGIQEIAFTDPTPDGREFAAAYTGTNNFLVYR